MGQFEYLAVLISIVLGLGLTHVLISVTRVIHTRRSARVYWVQLVWALNISLWMLAFWWFTFALTTVEVWTYGLFLFLIAYSVLLYVLAALLFPHDPPADQNYEAHFFANRQWFFGTLSVFALIDTVDFWVKVQTGSDVVTVGPYLVFILPILGLGVTAVFVGRRGFHAFFALMFLVWITAFSILTLVPMREG